MSDSGSSNDNQSSTTNQSGSRRGRKPKVKKSKLLFNVPKEIYEKALEEINNRDHTHDLPRDNTRRYCHDQTKMHFNFTFVPNHESFIFEGARQALEDRNWRAVYEIVNKALEMKQPQVVQQLYEYMYIAISHDPLIEDREKVIQDYLQRVKLIKDESRCKEYLKEVHSFETPPEEDVADEDRNPFAVREEDAQDDGLDNISEASVDFKLFEAIKTELTED